jgi:hypothetical protein
MRRFYLQRNADASGVSGCGKVAEGCQFDTKWCALVWLTDKSSMCYYPDIETLEGIHGHGGMTRVVWVDDESSNFCLKERLEAHLDPPKQEPLPIVKSEPEPSGSLKRARAHLAERRGTTKTEE